MTAYKVRRNQLREMRKVEKKEMRLRLFVWSERWMSKKKCVQWLIPQRFDCALIFFNWGQWWWIWIFLMSCGLKVVRLLICDWIHRINF